MPSSLLQPVGLVVRGDVWVADLDQTSGCEMGKCRPVVVVSHDRGNANPRNCMIVVVPITTWRHWKPLYPSQVILGGGQGGLRHTSLAEAIQVRAIDRCRLVERLGRLPNDVMVAIDDSLCAVLALSLRPATEPKAANHYTPFSEAEEHHAHRHPGH